MNRRPLLRPELLWPPAPTDDMKPYAGLPILVLFGDYVDEFPRWAPRLKNCRAFIAAANAAGGKAELLVLPEIGIKGNTHMLMQDDNSLDIADILIDWIGKHVSSCVSQRTGHGPRCHVRSDQRQHRP